MNRHLTVLFGVALVLSVAPLAGVRAYGVTESWGAASHEGLTHATDHVLVKLAPGADVAGVLGQGTVHVFGRWHKVPVPAERTPQDGVDDLRIRSGVEIAELDYVIQLDPDFDPVPLDHVDPVEVDDPFHSFQWHFPAVQLDSAWAQSTGAGVVVAVVDTGISQAGEDLTCHTFVKPYNAITGIQGALAANDDHGHGTHVAGTVAQCTNNGVGVAGVAFDASLMPVKVLDSTGRGTVSSLAAGIEWARANGANVINLSLGFDDPNFSDPMIDEAIEAAAADGVVIVAAAGNNNLATVSYPANHPDVIAVGATDFNNQRAPYSNRGTALDLVAPGGDNSRDANGDGYGDGVLQETFCDGAPDDCSPSLTGTTGWAYYFFNGTSMATPHVSGAAALLRCVAPGVGAPEVREALETTALDLGAPGFDTTYGHGLVQIHDAIESLAAPDTSPPSWQGGSALTYGNVTGTSVKLNWPKANDNACVAGYQIYKGSQLIGTTEATTTSTTVSNLIPATSYTFAVRARDVAGNLSSALSASVMTLDTIVPVWDETAELVVETYGETELTLVWEGATDNVGVTGYRLRLSGATGTLVSGRKAIVSGLQPGTSYQFEVLARDAAGNWSEPLSATVRTARSFTDTVGHVFYQDILWLSGMDITRGCNPPANDEFCPDDPVTRGQMAAFIDRALGLSSSSIDFFGDDDGTTFEADINSLAAAGISRGCNPPVNDRYCPEDPVTRGQMAAFINRALGLSSSSTDFFLDDDGTTFEADINALAAAGVTRGCNPPENDRFCPEDPVTRGQMAAFLKRALAGLAVGP